MITKMQQSVREILSSSAELIDQALDRLLPGPDQAPVSIHRAMRHSVFAGGKRLRPVLCMEAARMIAPSQMATRVTNIWATHQTLPIAGLTDAPCGVCPVRERERRAI